MMVKQWLQQNFKKNTNMSVEEMLNALNNLGDKLEQHGVNSPVHKAPEPVVRILQIPT